MHKVTIRKSGFYFLFWDKDGETWIEKNVSEGSLPITWYLNYPIQIEDSLTVREVIRMIEPYAEVLNVAMIHDLSAIDIEQLIDLAKETKATPNEIDPDTVYLVRIAESIPTVDNDDEFNFLSSYPVLVGIKQIDESGENDEVYSLSSLDFLDWCDLPFEIDDYVEYINPTTEEVMFEGVMNWSLNELIATILSQTAVTMQVMKNSVITTSQSEGPIEIAAVFNWLDDLDRILLK